VPPGTVIILNGTSSSGKTSILRQLQALLSEPYLEAGLDKFLWMLPSRYLAPPLWDEVMGRATTAGLVGQRLISGMHRAIAALSRAGNNVLAEHVFLDRAWLVECASLFHALPTYLIAVRCPLPVLEKRERERRDRTLGQARAQYLLVHAHAVYDLEVDTSLMSALQCAERIQAYVQDGNPPVAFQKLHRLLQ
jgi:chloramphenicol 3-O phosphotransferase